MNTLFRNALLAATALAGLAAAGCSGSSAPIPAPNLNSAPAGLSAHTNPSPTPVPLNFTTVDSPGSTTFNKVLDINELGVIVGTDGTGTASDPSNGYDSSPPYTKFNALNYPGALDTVSAGLSSSRYKTGYFVDRSKGHHTWGFVKDRGIWTLYKDTKAPNGPGCTTALLGINVSGQAVGYYIDINGNKQATELTVSNRHFSGFHPPGAVSATANGINQRGDVVGTETLGNGVTEGWLMRDGAYLQLVYPNAVSTQALGLNFDDDIVGSYTDVSGGTHGFILIHPNPSKEFWQSVDEPNAAGYTVLTSNNSHHAFTGWYVDSQGNTHGFVANAKQGGSGSARPVR
ncbi:MAG TPA: hypothetical protein VGG51_02040 [Candidatus Cybelea sp.]|jgi:hypothetical protein